jgi:Na+/proline symporter
MPQALSPWLILSVISGYFLLLIAIAWFSGRNADEKTFFLADRNSPWYLVAFGMIGASLSGVTFISIPGAVGAGGSNQAFAYMQMVFGYLFGYIFIAHVLLPIYYGMGLTTIYGFLEKRLGFWSYKTGAGFFLLSRVIGASFRLFLVAIVLQKFVMDPFGIRFGWTVFITIALIWIYTFRGGIKTIVITDTVQTFCLLTAVILTIIAIASGLEKSVWELPSVIRSSDYGQVFYFKGGWEDPNNFFKQFFSGALITIVMTGLDQDMMQKNLSCRNLREAKWNVYSLGWILIPVNLLFLALGALLYIYANQHGIPIPERSDLLYPTIAFEYLGPFVGVIFILGLVAAAYSSADSALTSLTTSFCVDFLDFEGERAKMPEKRKRYLRYLVHLGFSVLLFLVIVGFNASSKAAVINGLFKAAGYTYGPLLGMFFFGLFTRRKVRDKFVLPICLIVPIYTLAWDINSADWLQGFRFGFFILALNGLLTFLALIIFSKPSNSYHE